ncbi:hypothetical protein F4678DRAFT_453247 [Xylaria arbuscula]|nr:hypothetical protein F4678DRAFT_453247 [Xylaria arbuscula]
MTATTATTATAHIQQPGEEPVIPPRPRPFIPCYLCEKIIQGDRYECQVCGDVNLCSLCCNGHPFCHLLEVFACFDKPADEADKAVLDPPLSHRPGGESGSDRGLGYNGSNDSNGDSDSDSDSGSDSGSDDINDEDYEYNSEFNDPTHNAPNASRSVTTGALNLDWWSSLVTAQRRPLQAVPSQVTVNLSNEQFAIWLKETERIIKEATAAHIR